ncbi:ABC transporter permease [Brevibacterium paucivorans]|uniref:ABC transporter permease n=1 Tax=Brevibacterium paucivorans TaxID=170994 RepID=A0A2N6VNX4_9MICO|nr:ABC transporter permease [Brevibacterium paucivorans]PMD05852.1 ABC transporter permease [Brevibacterium paucivorans]
MTSYILRRLLQFVLTAAVASVVVFALMQILPGNAAQVALGTSATPEAVAALEEKYGLDRPIVVQYFDWIGHVLVGDFGTSYVTQAPIAPVIADSIQVTLIVVLASMVVALAVAVPLGTLAAVNHKNVVGSLISGASQIGIAIPNFLAGILLVMLFSLKFGWFPSSGWKAPSEGFGEFLIRLVLPVCALALVQAAILTRYVRSAVLDVMGEDFLRTARAKGQTKGRALVKHGLRNAAIPVVTVAGVQLATLLIGAVVIEQVFVIPGMGSELVRAVSNRDLITVQGIVLVLVVLVLALNTIIDLLYPVLDPRVRRVA